MVDFSKRLARKLVPRPVDPIAIYDTLDRASDKGPLRPAQVEVLQKWYESRQDERDLIIKLHTGQGKTLIGLLILQSRLNADAGPAVYLCPNNFLVAQTCEQARQFGVPFCTAEGDLPIDFYEGQSLLITSVQKLFNGLTKFGIGAQSEQVGALLLDDAHACIDAIRDATQIRLERGSGPYNELVALFSESLKEQGAGTFADIENGNHEAYLMVPYWAWRDKHDEVVGVLSKYNARNDAAIKFVWPILKDLLDECQCVVSGSGLEIAPYLPPLHLFGSYDQASHRIFMSATIAEDAFLIKGLGLSVQTILQPLTQKDEGWSGERMVLIPSLIDPRLNRGQIVELLAKPSSGRSYGVVALTPSFKRTRDWEKYGATVTATHTIDAEVQRLRQGEYEKTLVVANRYDGIDLPDAVCRILILDSTPHAESLIDHYEEACRSASEDTLTRTARKIEQGMGRSVRGEKDYCVVMLIGPDLVRSVRLRQTRRHLSPQTRKQIELGLDIASMAAEEAEEGVPPERVLGSLVRQCLGRDEGWKAFYAEQMEDIIQEETDRTVLDVFEKELNAERLYQRGDVDEAIRVIQALIDEHVASDEDRGWYLQQMARYLYGRSATRSNEMQVNAHRKNRYLLKPRSGMRFEKLQINQKRVVGIASWISQFETHEELFVALDSILSRLEFGVEADRFEAALDELAQALGFAGERPDREWKEGPDNLWALRAGVYLLIECKNEIKLDRAYINRGEAEQMNRSCAWFDRHYPGNTTRRLLIHPSHKVESAAAFTHDDVEIMRQQELRQWKKRIRAFFQEFASIDLQNLDESRIQELLAAHKLDVDQLLEGCAKSPFLMPMTASG